MRVLIVDDDFRRHVFLKRRLVGLAGEVVSVYRTCTAVEALSAGEFDVLFLDFDLEQQVGDAEDWWDEFMENNGWRVGEWLVGHPGRCPKRVVVHSLNAAGAQALRELVGGIAGVVCTREPWCWAADYSGLLWEELWGCAAAAAGGAGDGK